MKTSAPLTVSLKQLLLLFLSFVLLSMYSCKKEELMIPSKNGSGIESKYLIFNSDSIHIVGKILGDPSDRLLYPNRPYEVLNEQRILFFRQGDSANTIFFRITADVGKNNYFTPNNQYHYQLVNEYVLIIK